MRKDMGYPPLVTPTSQLVGTQAVQNVLAGERYKNVGAEMRAYCRGEYGKTPHPSTLRSGQRSSAMRSPSRAAMPRPSRRTPSRRRRPSLGDTARCEEDVLSYIAFPQVAENFFEKRKEAEEHSVRYSIEQI